MPFVASSVKHDLQDLTVSVRFLPQRNWLVLMTTKAPHPRTKLQLGLHRGTAVEVLQNGEIPCNATSPSRVVTRS